MNPIRKNLSDLLMASFLRHGGGIERLAEQAGFSKTVIETALTHGAVDAARLVHICRALGLDAAAVLAEASNSEPRHAVVPSKGAGGWHDITDADIPLPTDRFVQIQLVRQRGTLNPDPDCYLAHYLADGNHWMTGQDSTIANSLVARWREASPAQLDQLNEELAHA